MSEKRFVWKEEVIGNYVNEFIYDTSEDKELEIDDFAPLLNKYEKANNEKCRRIVSLLRENEKLKEENEQLKYDNTMFKQVIKHFQKVAQTDKRRLEDENEQLRKQNRIYEYFLDENDLSIDWSYFCTAIDCEETESDCKYCEYMKLVEKND